MPREPDCSFCAKFGRGEGAQWYDQVLVQRGDFVVIPSVGAMVEGYLMAVPRTHYRSMGEMSLAQLRELDQLRNEIVETLARHYCSPIVFEHGTGRARAGSCIDHAHLHFIPLQEDVLSILSRDLVFRKLKGLLDLAELGKASASYLYFEDQQRAAYVAEVEALPGQYVRRAVAALLGRPDRWDFLAYPDHDQIQATLQRLCPWPENAGRG